MFEVYEKGKDDIDDIPVFSSYDLQDAVSYCYNLGHNFTVYTLAEYHRTWDNVLTNKLQPTLPLEF